VQPEKRTESAPATAQVVAAAPLGVNIPAPKSELERIAQSAALATAARLASGRAVARPDFPLPTLQGLMRGPANYPGKVVLVNFWATWCGPCKKEIPDLMDLYSEYHARGLEVLGVALDGNTDVVRPYAENTGINYAVLVGNPEVGQQYQVTAVPTTVVYDRQGKVAQRLVGYQSRDALEAVIKSLL
jgi:thiol-disulfide isomerase/thioredoxin